MIIVVQFVKCKTRDKYTDASGRNIVLRGQTCMVLLCECVEEGGRGGGGVGGGTAILLD